MHEPVRAVGISLVVLLVIDIVIDIAPVCGDLGYPVPFSVILLISGIVLLIGIVRPPEILSYQIKGEFSRCILRVTSV